LLPGPTLGTLTDALADPIAACCSYRGNSAVETLRSAITELFAPYAAGRRGGLAFYPSRQRIPIMEAGAMSDTLDGNAKTIAEFRANEDRVGGNFEGT
jgi:hypothetical protein